MFAKIEFLMQFISFKQCYKLTRIIATPINSLTTSVSELILLVFLIFFHISADTNLYFIFFKIVTLRLLFNVRNKEF